MKKIVMIIISFALSLTATAQIADKISSGRPGQSFGSDTVGDGVFQIQSGLDLISSEVGSNKTQTQLFSNVFRYGFGDLFEINGGINYQSDEFDQSGTKTSQDGISSTQIGFRNRVIKESDGLIPSMAIQTRFNLKTVDKEYRSQEVSPIITFIFAHSLSESFSLTHNIGVNYSGNSISPTYFATSNLAQALTENYGWFVEIYGNMTNDIGGIFINAGGDYYISKDLKLDLSLGWGNNQSTDTFVSLGLSWRTF